MPPPFRAARQRSDAMPLRPPSVSAALPERGRGANLLVVGVLVCTLLLGAPAAAQIRPVAIENATVLTGTGLTLAPGTVTFQGGKITAVGKDVESTFLTRKIAARGKYVTPGLIDAHSTLALRWQPTPGLATAKAADAFDWFAEDEFRNGWRGGITAVYLPARTSGGIGGFGAVLRLGPSDDAGNLLLSDKTVLCATVAGAAPQGPLARIKVTEELRRRFQAAKDYRDAWNDYEENVKEYETKLAERAKKEASAASKPAAGKDVANKKDAANSSEPKKPESGEKKDEKKDELKKPDQPPKDRVAEVLLRVLDGELRLRVEAHEPADILNVLDLAEEFNLAVIVEGATGAYLVADRLAERHVPVVLSAPAAPLAFAPGPARFERPEAAAILRQAGVDVYFGSGVLPSPEAAPQLALRAARAVGHGFDPDAAFESITFGAARLLGVEQEIGQLREGLKADLVIWTDHPLSGSARVERVFVGGREVYHTGDETQERDE